MKTRSTDQLLTLGMALTTDRRTMERRVRGVFARKKSAKGIVALSLMLALALGFGAFTTACQPGQPIASGSDALVSGGDAVISGENALASGENDTTDKDAEVAEEYTKEKALHWLAFSLNEARKFPAPRMEDIVFTERGTWEIQQMTDASEQGIAVNRFLEIANAIFEKSYTQEDMATTYYIDQSGFRSDLWRFDSKDGVLSGALDADNLALISVDCLDEPGDTLHSSLTDTAQNPVRVDYWGTLDPTSAVDRVAKILGGTAQELKDFGGSGRDNATAGWMIQSEVQFQLGDGRYCSVRMFADEALTPTTVCVYPDAACAEESVFWRADLENNPDVIQLLSSEDFRVGEPTEGDMTRPEAIAFFEKIIEVAGSENVAPGDKPPEPSTEFYVDASGTRENYWRVEGSGFILELASKTGRMLSLSSNGSLGTKLGLSDIPSDQLGEKEYQDATQALFTALFGKNAVESVSLCNKDNYFVCTMDLYMTDGTLHEVKYNKGRLIEDSVYFRLDPNTWESVPEWLEKWTSVDDAGKISIPGFDNCSWMVTPKWIASGVYIHNETGELFARE